MAVIDHISQSTGEYKNVTSFETMEFVDNQDFEIEMCKRKMYDLVCAEADGIAVEPHEKELAKLELQGIIVSHAQQIFETNREHMTELEALGSAGVFVESHVGSLTDAILGLYGGEVPENIKHRPIDMIISDRLTELRAVYRTEPEKVDPRVLIKDACLNALLYNYREVAFGLKNLNSSPVDATIPKQEEEIPEPAVVSRRVGFLARIGRLGLK